MMGIKDERVYDLEEVMKIASMFFNLGEAAALSSKQWPTWNQRSQWRNSHKNVYLNALQTEHYRDTSQDSKVVISSPNYYEEIWNVFNSGNQDEGDDPLSKHPEESSSKSLPKKTRKGYGKKKPIAGEEPEGAKTGT